MSVREQLKLHLKAIEQLLQEQAQVDGQLLSTVDTTDDDSDAAAVAQDIWSSLTTLKQTVRLLD